MDCLSALGSAALNLPSNSSSPNTDALPPSKKSRKSRAGSSSASPKRSSSQTFYSSMDDPGVASWIASARAGRASRTALPVSAAAPPTSDGSGTISPASSMRPERLSFSERTSADSCGTLIAQLSPSRTWMTPQLTLLGEWEPFSGIWPKWGSASGGEVYQLPAWAPRTGGPESSSWPAVWPTPDAQAMNDGADPKLHAARQERLAAKHNNSNGAGTPLAMRVQNWPTPRAEERCQYNSRDDYEALSLKVQHWLTPRTPNGGKKLDAATTRRKGMDADGIKRTVDLSNQAEYWAGTGERRRFPRRTATGAAAKTRRSGGRRATT